MKQTLLEMQWEVSPHTDIASSDFHLFQSMQHALEDTHFHNFEAENLLKIISTLKKNFFIVAESIFC